MYSKWVNMIQSHIWVYLLGNRCRKLVVESAWSSSNLRLIRVLVIFIIPKLASRTEFIFGCMLSDAISQQYHLFGHFIHFLSLFLHVIDTYFSSLFQIIQIFLKLTHAFTNLNFTFFSLYFRQDLS